jgi:ankyrin repeat protein
MKNIDIKSVLICIILIFSFIVLLNKFLPYSLTHKITTIHYSREDLILDAILVNNICATQFLIEHKIDINKKYKYGHTLLHNAALYGDINMIKLLVKNDAKLIKNDFELTAIDSARDNNHSDVVEYLVGCYSDFGRMNKYKYN